jgi:NADH-quinone oxidoreductase subunit L
VQQHIHEPAATVMLPLYVLAALSVFGGLIGLPQLYGNLIGIPDSNSLAHFLAPVVGEAEHAIAHGTEVRLALSAVGAAAAGFALAWLFYLARPELPGRVRAAFPALWRAVRDKYWVDEAIDAVIVRPLVAVSDRVLYRGIDAGLIDGAGVNGTAAAVRGSALHVLRRIQSGLTQSYLALMLAGAAAVVAWMVG